MFQVVINYSLLFNGFSWMKTMKRKENSSLSYLQCGVTQSCKFLWSPPIVCVIRLQNIGLVLVDKLFPHTPFALVSDFISPSKSVNAPIRGSMLKHPLFFSRPEIRAAPGDEVNHESIRSRMQSRSNCRGTASCLASSLATYALANGFLV